MRQCSMTEIKSMSKSDREFFMHFAFQVDDDIYEGPSSKDSVMLDAGNFINHSCCATTWFSPHSCRQLISRVDIYPGEEVTYDYACSDSSPPLNNVMLGIDGVDDEVDEMNVCYCKHALCRGTLHYDDWKNPIVLSRYYGHMSPYLNQKVKELPEGPLYMRGELHTTYIDNNHDDTAKMESIMSLSLEMNNNALTVNVVSSKDRDAAYMSSASETDYSGTTVNKHYATTTMALTYDSNVSDTCMLMLRDKDIPVLQSNDKCNKCDGEGGNREVMLTPASSSGSMNSNDSP